MEDPDWLARITILDTQKFIKQFGPFQIGASFIIVISKQQSGIAISSQFSIKL